MASPDAACRAAAGVGTGTAGGTVARIGRLRNPFRSLTPGPGPVKMHLNSELALHFEGGNHAGSPVVFAILGYMYLHLVRVVHFYLQFCLLAARSMARMQIPGKAITTNIEGFLSISKTDINYVQKTMAIIISRPGQYERDLLISHFELPRQGGKSIGIR